MIFVGKTPFSMDFGYSLREGEIGRKVKLAFTAEVVAKTPSGGWYMLLF